MSRPKIRILQTTSGTTTSPAPASRFFPRTRSAPSIAPSPAGTAETYHQLSEIAASRYKTPDLTKTIPSHKAWTDEQLPNNRLRLTSHLCGISFAVGDDRDLQVGDISNGVCTVTSNPPTKRGAPVATILLMAKRPAEGQSLDDFVKSFLKDHDTFQDDKTQVSTASDLPCPVERCLSLDLLSYRDLLEAGRRSHSRRGL